MTVTCKNIAVFADHGSNGLQQQADILIDTCWKPTWSQVGLHKVPALPKWNAFPLAISPCDLSVTKNPRIKGLVCCFGTINRISSYNRSLILLLAYFISCLTFSGNHNSFEMIKVMPSFPPKMKVVKFFTQESTQMKWTPPYKSLSPNSLT